MKVWLQAGKSSIASSDSLKLLGFKFGEQPCIALQIENLISRATKRMFVLRYYAKFMPGGDLTKLYSALVRSVLEYSSVTYHSLLTRGRRMTWRISRKNACVVSSDIEKLMKNY